MNTLPKEIYLQSNLKLTEDRTVRDPRFHLNYKETYPGPTQRPNNSIPLLAWLKERIEEGDLPISSTNFIESPIIGNGTEESPLGIDYAALISEDDNNNLVLGEDGKLYVENSNTGLTCPQPVDPLPATITFEVISFPENIEDFITLNFNYNGNNYTTTLTGYDYGGNIQTFANTIVAFFPQLFSSELGDFLTGFQIDNEGGTSTTITIIATEAGLQENLNGLSYTASANYLNFNQNVYAPNIFLGANATTEETPICQIIETISQREAINGIKFENSNYKLGGLLIEDTEILGSNTFNLFLRDLKRFTVIATHNSTGEATYIGGFHQTNDTGLRLVGHSNTGTGLRIQGLTNNVNGPDILITKSVIDPSGLRLKIDRLPFNNDVEYVLGRDFNQNLCWVEKSSL